MGIDQRHEQLNADVKGVGGEIGLTEDDNMLLRWMVCGPEEANMVRECEKSCLLNDTSNDTYRHHEDSKSFEMMFFNDVENLEREFIQVGNPFQTETSELINLVTNDLMDETVVNSARTVEKLGAEQKTAFLTKLHADPSLFNEPIKKNNLPLLSRAQNKKGGKNKNQEIKEQLHLYSELYVATQVRGGDMDEFFLSRNIVISSVAFFLLCFALW